MAKPYSIDLRKRTGQAYLRGDGTQAQIAQRFDVSPYAVGRLTKHFKTTGSYQPLSPSGGNPTQNLFEHHWTLIEAWLDDDPTLMWPQVADRLLDVHDITITPSQLS